MVLQLFHQIFLQLVLNLFHTVLLEIVNKVCDIIDVVSSQFRVYRATNIVLLFLLHFLDKYLLVMAYKPFDCGLGLDNI